MKTIGIRWNHREVTEEEAIEALMWYFNESPKEAKETLWHITPERLRDVLDSYVRR